MDVPKHLFVVEKKATERGSPSKETLCKSSAQSRPLSRGLVLREGKARFDLSDPLTSGGISCGPAWARHCPCVSPPPLLLLLRAVTGGPRDRGDDQGSPDRTGLGPGLLASTHWAAALIYSVQ